VHIVQRGHNRDCCFFNRDDYARYFDWLIEGVEQTGCELHAYVLMSNHVHALVTPREASAIPKLLMSVGRRYVHYVNRSYERRGTLWQGRYHSSLIATDDYLLACYRYIELNPVRAGIVKDPGDYCWSSYGANALGRLDRGLVPHRLYTSLGRTDEARRAAYRGLFGSPENPQIVDELRRSLNRSEPVGEGRKVRA
jgi:putative transposase